MGIQDKDDGTYKTRFVVRGCQQAKGTIDFKDTFSPVVEISSSRIIFATAAQQNLQMKTFDLKTAFLYATLEEDKPIYMTLPEGYEEKGKIAYSKSTVWFKQTPSH